MKKVDNVWTKKMRLKRLNWIKDSYIPTNVPEGRDVHVGLPMPLTPNELVQVACEFCGMATFHALKFTLRS